jgi:hypothetical protein
MRFDFGTGKIGHGPMIIPGDPGIWSDCFVIPTTLAQALGTFGLVPEAGM